VQATRLTIEGKVRYSRAAAMRAASFICQLLKPWVEELKVCGSLRRGKQWVGDIEIVYIPKLQRVLELAQSDLLSGSPAPTFTNLTDLQLQTLINKALIRKRTNALGSISWGEKNKYAVDCATGIPIDFFAATRENWWNYIVCRTGGADNNSRISSAAQSRGLHWHPYERGFTCHTGTYRRGKWLRVRSELAVFAIAGLPYLEPHER
jgi:DNA polymerase/3'-5' exonuclease PolX